MTRTSLSAASTPALLHLDQKRRDRYALHYYEIEQIESTIADGVNLRRELTALAFPQQLTAD